MREKIVEYEMEFGEHNCSDCNQESIWNETGGFYIVRSCGNNLVEFENFKWWVGEGDFGTREQQTYGIMIDI